MSAEPDAILAYTLLGGRILVLLGSETDLLGKSLVVVGKTLFGKRVPLAKSLLRPRDLDKPQMCSLVYARKNLLARAAQGNSYCR